MLEPGEYRINATIAVNANGVKLRGYGGAWPDGTFGIPVTNLLWVGPAGSPIIRLIPAAPVTNNIQDIELSHH